MSLWKSERHIFLVLSVASLILGIGIYCLEEVIAQTGGFLFNHLPDGLWAFSLTSLLVFIWFQNPGPLFFWIPCAVLMMLIFEFLQYKNVLKGTGDVKDAVTCIVFSALPLLIKLKSRIMKNRNLLSLLAVAFFGLFAIASSDEEIDALFEPTSVGEVAMNEGISIDGVEWMATAVQTLDHFRDSFGDRIKPVDSSTMFIKVSGKTTNRNKETDLELGDLYLVDGDDAEYAEHEDSLEGLIFEELSRNVPKKWTSVFEVPKSIPKPIKLKVTNFESVGYIVLMAN